MMSSRIIATIRMRTLSRFEEAVLAALRSRGDPQPTYWVRNCLQLDGGWLRSVTEVRAALQRLAKWGKVEQVARNSPHLHWRVVPDASPEPRAAGEQANG